MIHRVHPDKISKYLLDVTSKRGGPKARFFLSRGFQVGQPEAFAEALKRHAVEAALRSREVDPEGHRLVYECAMAAADGTRPCIRSVWIEAADASSCRLLTAYPITPPKVAS